MNVLDFNSTAYVSSRCTQEDPRILIKRMRSTGRGFSILKFNSKNTD
jgi:hypothetical protein